MITYIYFLLVGCFFLCMLIFPTSTFEGACEGLVLWFQTVLPTLLPFVIISNLLVNSNCIHLITKLFRPLFQKVFRVSSAGCYPILVGFLCGYPVGAKVTADLVNTKHISRAEGQYLLSFCNNTSPMFIISYLVLQNFSNTDLVFPVLFILIFAPILCSFVFRTTYRFDTDFSRFHNANSTPHFDFSILDCAIMNGFETITRVGGYIILFSVIFSLGKMLPFPIILSFLEITRGIPFLLELSLPEEIQFILCLALVSFGGLCSVIQTRSMIQDTGLLIRPYIKEKLITAMVTSLIAYIYILFIGS